MSVAIQSALRQPQSGRARRARGGTGECKVEPTIRINYYDVIIKVAGYPDDAIARYLPIF